MNVQSLKDVSVIPTLCMPTLMALTSVDVSVDIRVMEGTVLVIRIHHMFSLALDWSKRVT